MAALCTRKASILTLFLSLSSLLLQQCHSSTYKCNMTDNRDTDDEFIWYTVGDFRPLPGITCGFMYLGRVNHVEFDLLWGGRTTTNEAEMFFRVGYDSIYGTFCDGQNSNYPSLWINAESNHLMLGVSDHDSCVRRYVLDDYGDLSTSISHHVEMFWNDTLLTVNITGGGKADYYNSWEKVHPDLQYIGQIVPVWFMSTKFGSTEYNTANGTFSNMVIRASQFSNDSVSPTMEPTNEPTMAPEDKEDGAGGGGSTATVIIVIIILILACGGLWYWNKNNQRQDDEVVFKEAPETKNSPLARKKKGPKHARTRSQEELDDDGGDSLKATVNSQGHKVYMDAGLVAGTTFAAFKSPEVLQSPPIDTAMDNGDNTFDRMAIPEDEEDDDMNHPSPDVDDYYAPDDEAQMVNQRLSNGPPPRPPPRKKY